MKKANSFAAIIILIIALGFLMHGFFSSRHKVYDNPDVLMDEELSSFTEMTETGLLKEMCYGAIVSDNKGNLINKERKAACPSCTAE
jgi:hypothetical protein